MDTQNTPVIDNINTSLNDDCLIIIFEYLPVEDKLKIERVCKRWENLGKESWSKIRNFDFDLEMNREWPGYINFATNVIRRCGKYLTNLSIDANFDTNCLLLLKEISNICKNIENFKLKRYCFKIYHDDERSLGLFFKNNKQISIFSPKESNISSDCLSNLCTESIRELYITYHHYFDTQNTFCDFLRKLKNLTVIHLCSQHVGVHPTNIIIALNKSKCVSIREFFIYCLDICTTELSKLLCKQKELRKLSLINFCVDGNFLNSLIDCPVQELEIMNVVEELSYSLRNFKNLTIFICYIYDLTDEIVKNLTKCVNLKKIDMQVKKCSLTEEGKNGFDEFSNLESFTYSGSQVTIGPILGALSRYNENLKELYLNHCDHNLDSVFENISLHKNLIFLRLRLKNVKNLTKLVDTLNNLHNLKEIVLRDCSGTDINLSFFKKINDAKINQGDRHVLKICVDNHHLECFDKEFSLISVQYKLKKLFRDYYDYFC